ncbi:transport and Golgi organization protein 1 homolog [Physella acuta]|uniref:transport and Golgi organization protein 1 homolog n=1 Tax=Physella acuta TaxID=109671 RepID=UPI0027DB707C|nr:transport and Golgi organization protein 1 homolog [Physella acuta]
MAAYNVWSKIKIIFMLLVIIVKCTHTAIKQERISNKRLCADAQCSTVISRARALARYSENHPLFLTFNQGDTILIKSKSAGDNTRLWGGELNGRFGYFDKSFVREYQVLFREPSFLVNTEKDKFDNIGKQPLPRRERKNNEEPVKQAAPVQAEDSQDVHEEKVVADPIVEIPNGDQDPTKPQKDADPLSQHSNTESEEDKDDSDQVKDDEPKEHKEEIEDKKVGLGTENWDHLNHVYLDPERDRFDTSDMNSFLRRKMANLDGRREEHSKKLVNPLQDGESKPMKEVAENVTPHADKESSPLAEDKQSSLNLETVEKQEQVKRETVKAEILENQDKKTDSDVENGNSEDQEDKTKSKDENRNHGDQEDKTKLKVENGNSEGQEDKTGIKDENRDEEDVDTDDEEKSDTVGGLKEPEIMRKETVDEKADDDEMIPEEQEEQDEPAVGGDEGGSRVKIVDRKNDVGVQIFSMDDEEEEDDGNIPVYDPRSPSTGDVNARLPDKAEAGGKDTEKPEETDNWNRAGIIDKVEEEKKQEALENEPQSVTQNLEENDPVEPELKADLPTLKSDTPLEDLKTEEESFHIKQDGEDKTTHSDLEQGEQPENVVEANVRPDTPSGITAEHAQTADPVVVSEVKQTADPVMSEVKQTADPVVASEVKQTADPVVASEVKQTADPVMSEVKQTADPVVVSEAQQTKSAAPPDGDSQSGLTKDIIPNADQSEPREKSAGGTDASIKEKTSGADDAGPVDLDYFQRDESIVVGDAFKDFFKSSNSEPKKVDLSEATPELDAPSATVRADSIEHSSPDSKETLIEPSTAGNVQTIIEGGSTILLDEEGNFITAFLQDEQPTKVTDSIMSSELSSLEISQLRPTAVVENATATEFIQEKPRDYSEISLQSSILDASLNSTAQSPNPGDSVLENQIVNDIYQSSEFSSRKVLSVSQQPPSPAQPEKKVQLTQQDSPASAGQVNSGSQAAHSTDDIKDSLESGHDDSYHHSEHDHTSHTDHDHPHTHTDHDHPHTHTDHDHPHTHSDHDHPHTHSGHGHSHSPHTHSDHGHPHTHDELPDAPAHNHQESELPDATSSHGHIDNEKLETSTQPSVDFQEIPAPPLSSDGIPSDYEAAQSFQSRKITDGELTDDKEEITQTSFTKSIALSLESFTKVFVEKLPPSVQTFLEMEPLGLSPNMTVLVTIFTLVSLVIVSLTSSCSSRGKKHKLRDTLEVIQDLEAKLQLAIKEKENIEDSIKESKTENLKLKEELTKHKKDSGKSSSDFHALQSENEALVKQIAMYESEIQKLNINANSKQGEAKQTSKKAKELEKQIKKMEEREKKLEQENSKFMLEIRHKDEEITTLMTKLNSLTEQTGHLQTSKDQVCSLNLIHLSILCHLLAEAEDWKEKVIDLKERLDQREEEFKQMQETISFKENEMEVLKDCFLQLKSFEEEEAEGDDGENNNERVLEKVKAMMDVSKVNAALRAIEEEKDVLANRLQIESEARKELEEQLENSRRSVETSMADKMKAERQCQEAQTKLNVLSTYFKEKEMQLQRELGEQEALKKQNLHKLVSADETTRSIQQEMELIRTQNESLKRELTSSERDFRSQIAANEKKAHENWLSARAAERELKEARHEAGVLRQKLTDIERRQFMGPGGLIRPLPTRGLPPPGMMNGPPPPGMDRSPSRGSMPPLPPPHLRDEDFLNTSRERIPISPMDLRRGPLPPPGMRPPPPEARSPPLPRLPLFGDARSPPPRMPPPPMLEGRSPPPYDRRPPPHMLDRRSPPFRHPHPDMLPPPMRGPPPPHYGRGGSPSSGTDSPHLDRPDGRYPPPYARNNPPFPPDRPSPRQSGQPRQQQSQV